VSDWTDISPPRQDSSDCEIPAVPVEGQVASWIKRTDDGGIVVGDVFQPKDYALARLPHEGLNPSHLIGTHIELDSVGSIHITDQGGLTHAVPRDSGVYLLIDTDHEHELR
jgi:hypothetical protein